MLSKPSKSTKHFFKKLPFVGTKLKFLSQQFSLWLRADVEKAKKYLELGNSLTQDSKLKEALGYYNKAISLQSSFPEAYFYRGNVLQAQGNCEQAIQDYNNSLELGLDWAELHFNFGTALDTLGKLEEASKHHQKVVVLKSDWAEAYWRLGSVLDRQGKSKEAIHAYEKAIALKPDWKEPYLYLGTVLNTQGKYEEALIQYQKAIELSPNSVELHYQVGTLLDGQERLEEATFYYQKTLILNPKWTEVYSALGAALERQNKLEEALINYQEAVNLNPNLLEAYSRIGCVLDRQGKLEEAIFYYKKTLVLNPGWAEVYCYIGAALERQGKIEAALEHYQQSINIKPELSEGFYGIARVLDCKGKLQEAIYYYQQTILLKPDWIEIYVCLGKVLDRKGDLEEAIEIYEDVISICENETDDCKKLFLAQIYFLVGNVLLQQGKYQEALQNHRQALTLDSEWLAEQYFSLGCKPVEYHSHLEGVLLLFEQISTLKPQWIEGYYEAGNWMMHSGYFERAMEFWKKCIQVQSELAQELEIETQGIRVFGADYTRNIGHMGLLDFHIKMHILGSRPLNNKAVIFAPQVHKIANRCLFKYWNQYLPVIEEPLEHPEIASLLKYVEERAAVVTFPDGKALYYCHAAAATQKQWEDEKRSPLLKLSDSDYERGWDCLQKLGLSKDAWFVCLHVREGGFYRQWSNSSVRDADINTYLPAAQSIVERGGWVIRMGDHTMKPLEQMPQIIDYAHSNLKSDWMDVFLWSQCRFFIGTNSGPFLVSSAFGVPCALTNWVPIKTPPYFGNSIFIPKLFWLESEQRYLTFAETLSLTFGIGEWESYYTSKNIKVIDNTPEDINNLVQEMIESIENSMFQKSQKDGKAQKQFRLLVESYGGYSSNSRVGQRFLEKCITLGLLDCAVQ